MLASDERPDRRKDDRTEIRFAARIKTGLRLALDSALSDADNIASIVVGNLSHDGTSTTTIESLYVGAAVILEVPLVGWRPAEVMWIADDRAGCRFVQPLTQDELRAAITASPVISDLFPGFAAQIQETSFDAWRSNAT
jgi:hypothetical protein